VNTLTEVFGGKRYAIYVLSLGGLFLLGVGLSIGLAGVFLATVGGVYLLLGIWAR
jgi:hypothetical protein